MAKKRIRFMCTAFRDGFQSVYGARVLTDDFLPAVAAARDAGIDWMEVGGGARFQSLYFYCNEDAFRMMDRIRETAGPDVNLQTLARGVNVVGLDSQPSDVIALHAKLFKKHGISSIRNFDALNDVNNLVYSGQCIHDAGLQHQVSVTMMELPPGCEGAHDAAFYEKSLRDILDADIPFDSVCFKDASGTSVPSKIYETIRRARRMLPEGTLIDFHSHETAGIGVVGYKAALDAGADAIDLSLAPVSGGTCQPDVVVMWHALRGTEYDLGIDIDKVLEAEKVFKACMEDYFVPPEAKMVEPLIPWSPMPGGALTSNTQMLRDNGIMDRFAEISHAMGDVVRRGGFGTSVTPVSQFYFQQAFNNVMFGPWKKIAEGYGKVVLGYYGRTPFQPDEEVVAIAQEQLGLPPTDKTPLELNDADQTKGLKQAGQMLEDAGLEQSEENLFIAATCKEKGITFLKGEAKLMVRKPGKQHAVDPEHASAATGSNAFKVKINETTYEVQARSDGNLVVEGVSYRVQVSASEGASGNSAEAGHSTTTVDAPMPGNVCKVVGKVGDKVEEGSDLIILEAMKMEVPVKAPVTGTVVAIEVSAGDVVKSGQVLVHLD